MQNICMFRYTNDQQICSVLKSEVILELTKEILTVSMYRK